MTPSFWAVVETESQREPLVRLLLMRTNRETYCPRIKTKTRITPLFPRYLFVRVVDGHWWDIRWTPHVLRVLTFGQFPQVDEKLERAIVVLRQQEDRDHLVKLPKLEELRRGQPVHIRSGQFAGHLALHDSMTSHDRQRVLLRLLGQVVTVELPAKDCVVVA